MAASSSVPSDPAHAGKANVTGRESNPNAFKPAPSNIAAETRNGSTLFPTLDATSTPVSISAISGSATPRLPQANGSNPAGTASIASKDNHTASSGPSPGLPSNIPQSTPVNKDSQNGGPVHDTLTQPAHGNSVPAAMQAAGLQSGPSQAPVVAALVDAGRQPVPSHAATAQFRANPALSNSALSNPASRNLPTSAESAALTSSVGESGAPLSMGPVQIAQIVSKATQSEMRIGLNTSAFGNVEVRTVVHASEVGLVIGSERGDLRSLLGNELPGIANTLQQQNLRLNEVNFHQGFTFSGNSSSGGDSQPRSFTPPPVPVHSVGGGNTADNSTEPVVTEALSRRRHGLNILA